VADVGEGRKVLLVRVGPHSTLFRSWIFLWMILRLWLKTGDILITIVAALYVSMFVSFPRLIVNTGSCALSLLGKRWL